MRGTGGRGAEGVGEEEGERTSERGRSLRAHESGLRGSSASVDSLRQDVEGLRVLCLPEESESG